jgi:hypothetical protein
LRDVERAIIVFKYFCETRHFSDGANHKAYLEGQQSVSHIARSLILAVSVCYHARLQDRTEYESYVVKQFIEPLNIPGGSKQFKKEIKWSVEQNKCKSYPGHTLLLAINNLSISLIPCALGPHVF